MKASGWGQKARPNKNVSAEYVFYSFTENTPSDINIYNNEYINSLRIFYVWYGTKYRFKTRINIDNDKLVLNKDSILINDEIAYKQEQIKQLQNKYIKEENAAIQLLEEEQIENVNREFLLESDDFNKIKKYYSFISEAKYQNKVDLGPIQGYKYKKENQDVILVYNEKGKTKIPYTSYTATDIFGNKIENSDTLTVSDEPILIYNLDETKLYSNIKSNILQ